MFARALLAALPVVVLCGLGCTAQAEPGTALATDVDRVTASYAFASELGSGIYEINGRALQIYRLPFALQHDGWRLTLPVTVGLLDFRSSDVLLLHLPSGIGSVSLVPGLEGDWDVASNWRLTPYVKAGFTKTSGRQSNVASFGLGLRSDLLRPGALRNADGQVVPRAFEYTFHQELNLAVADMRGTAPSDQFLRWRNGVEIDRDTGLTWHNRQLRIAPFALLDTYLDPPLSILTGRKADRWQGEVGFSVGLSPAPQLLGAAVPALGFSYRIAGELSGWHLAIGRPF
jgi:hypothetical protein